MNGRVIAAVMAAVDRVNADLPPALRMPRRLDAVLIGPDRGIDSIGVVTLLAAVEDEVARAFGQALRLGEDQADLGTLGSLAGHVAALLANGSGGAAPVPSPNAARPARMPSRAGAKRVKGATPILFIGAGPFPEQVEIVRDINAGTPAYEVIGVLDDDPALAGTTIAGTPVLGPLERVSEFPDAALVMGIGTHRSRTTLARVLDRLALPAERFATLIHPGAKVYASARIGAGSIVHAGCIVGNDTVVGPFCKIIWNAVIGARNVLGRGVTVCPQAVTGVGARIGPFAFLGIAAAVADHVTVGPMAAVGMSSPVGRDVPAGAFLFGNPPRVLSSEPVPEDILAEWRDDLARAEASA